MPSSLPPAGPREVISPCMLENVLDKSHQNLPQSHLPMPILSGFLWRNRHAARAWPRLGAFLLSIFICLAFTGGCSRFRSKLPDQYVYVTAKQTFLRDRVAAVSNRTGTVQNGDKLEVIEHGRRFFHVKTDKGEIGWIDEKAVATQQVFDEFQALGEAHKNDPAVASAVVRDEVNLHLKPGRDTERFYRLAEGDKLQLIERATLPKPASAIIAPAKIASTPGTAPDAPPPIAMEDWWLARDARGRAGWLLSRMLDVDAPDSLTRYAEGQKIVGAYLLGTVNDPGAPQDDKNIPMYVTVLGPYLAGLPYDFDQVRVFTWNTKMHRYETAYREKNIEGYLPVTVTMQPDPYGKSPTAQTPMPTFTYKVLAADAPPSVPDSSTGIVTPGRTIAKTFRLEGNLVRRIAPPGTHDDPEAHPAPEEKKEKTAAKKARKR